MKEIGDLLKESKPNTGKESSQFQDLQPTNSENKNTKGIGKKTPWVASAHINIPMEQFIEENGSITNIMGKENMNLQTEQSTRANGKITNCMELDFLSIIMDENGKENSEMENLKVEGKGNLFEKKPSQSENKP